MAKNLKLTGIKSFIAAFTNGDTVKKGEVIRVSDKIAATLEKSTRLDKEGEPVYYWTEPTASDKVTRDFTGEGEGLGEPAKVAVEADAAPVRRTAGRQRSSAQ